MGIDFGERRIGLSLSDPTGTLATPLDTMMRRVGKRPPLARLEAQARAQFVDQLVVGLPLDRAGRETEWCAEVRAMGDELGRRLGVPVAYVDERMTSMQAERTLRSLDLPKNRREEKGRVDAAAAALILQAWLDRPGDRSPPGAP